MIDIVSGNCEVKKKLVFLRDIHSDKKIKSASRAVFSGKQSTTADISTTSQTPVQTIHSRVHFADLLRVFAGDRLLLFPKYRRE